MYFKLNNLEMFQEPVVCYALSAIQEQVNVQHTTMLATSQRPKVKPGFGSEPDPKSACFKPL